MYQPKIMGKEISAILLATILLMSMAMIVTVQAAEQTVNTEATVSVCADPPPTVKAKWEALDEDFATPCVQIYPELEGEVPVAVFAVVEDADGIGDIAKVYMRILHPDGTIKYEQIDMQLVPEQGWEEAKILALASGHLTPEEAIELDYELSEGLALMYTGVFILHYCQPAGNYGVIVYVVDNSGNIGMLENWDVEYVAVAGFRIDFTAVNFGDVKPCIEKPVPGDWDMTTPDRPTIMNIGNVPLEISVHFTTMIGDIYGKEVDEFDASIHLMDGLREKQYTIGCVPITFQTILELCHTEKLDFSVHAIEGTPTDTYRGTVTISAEDARL
jgi:hypothetical protein